MTYIVVKKWYQKPQEANIKHKYHPYEEEQAKEYKKLHSKGKTSRVILLFLTQFLDK